MKVLIIGSGGREHALAWKIRKSPRVSAIYCAPGNAGTELLGENVPVPVADHYALLQFVKANGIDLTVVGPDDALGAGLVDYFEEHHQRIFGPTRHAARLEWSKIFAKQFMERWKIPTASARSFSWSSEARKFCLELNYPIVIKADGLALGKGVIIAHNSEEAQSAIEYIMDGGKFGSAGKSILIEEFLTGTECSIHAVIDGSSYLLFPAAKDHKPIYDGNQGPNTGGMGTFSPPPQVDEAIEREIREKVLDPLMAGLKAEGILYKGLLFPGLMLTANGVRVLEFNCRFGDPETQVLLPRLKSDLVELIEAAIDGKLDETQPEWDPRAAVCVVMASGGYPGSYEKGHEISGLEEFTDRDDIVIFHAGTKRQGEKVVTAGGRVLGVTALGTTLSEAREKAYAAVGRIHFHNAYFRKDIGIQ